jgi:hypothetical protein
MKFLSGCADQRVSGGRWSRLLAAVRLIGINRFDGDSPPWVNGDGPWEAQLALYALGMSVPEEGCGRVATLRL